MDSVDKLPPQDNSQTVKADTLSVIFKNKEKIIQTVEQMTPEMVDEFIEQLVQSPEVPKIDHDHPFGYYSIPILTNHLEREIKSPFDIKYVSDDHPFFKGRDDLGRFDPADLTVYLRQSNFTNLKRVLGWIGLGPDPNDLNEDTIEHEIRHGLPHKYLNGPFGGGISNITEGFAWSTKFQPYLSNTDPFARFDKKLRYESYRGNFYDPEKIAKYCSIFQIAQSLKIDDVKLLQYMEDNNWWAGSDEEWYLNPKKVKANVLKHINYDGKEDKLLTDNTFKKATLSNFQYAVWKQLKSFLEKHEISPDINWETELREEREIQNEWAKHSASTSTPGVEELCT